MLEWLKEILGDSYTEDIDGRVSAEIGKGFVARADFNTKNDEVKTLQGQLKTAQDGLKAFDGVDVEGLKDQIKKLQDDMAAQADAFKFDTLLGWRHPGREGQECKGCSGTAGHGRAQRVQRPDRRY